MALSYINNKEIKFGSSKPLNGVYTPGSPTREYEPLDSLGIYLNSGIPLSYGIENNRYMSVSDKFAATSQGNSYSFNQLFAAQMMLGFKLHDRFIACDTEHKIIGTEPLLQKAYLAEITEKTLDYFKIKIYGDKTRTFCIRMSASEVPTSYIDLTNSFDENGLNLTQTDRQSFLSYYRFYPLTARDFSSRAEETLGVDYYLLPSVEGLKELSGDILSKFNAFISSEGRALTSLGNTAFAYAGDINYALNYKGETPEAAVSAAKKAEVILGQVEEMHAGINQILPEMEENLELTKQYRDEAMSTEIGTVREDLNQLKGDLYNKNICNVDVDDIKNSILELYVIGTDTVDNLYLGEFNLSNGVGRIVLKDSTDWLCYINFAENSPAEVNKVYKMNTYRNGISAFIVIKSINSVYSGLFPLHKDVLLLERTHFIQKYLLDDYENIKEKVDVLIPTVKTKILCLGDSIFGLERGDTSIPSLIKKYTNCETYNCAMGGTQVVEHDDTFWRFYDFENISKAIAYNDWSNQLNNLSDEKAPYYFTDVINQLSTMDFSTIDILVLNYGGNDYGNSICTELQFRAVYFSGIQRIMERYKNMRVLIATPPYKYYLDDTTHEFIDDGDTRQNAQGLTLLDFVEYCKLVANTAHVPCVDLYNEISINKFNKETYFNTNDGSHFNENGRKVIASKMADSIKSMITN